MELVLKTTLLISIVRVCYKYITSSFTLWHFASQNKRQKSACASNLPI